MKENYQKSKATLLAELSSSENGLSSAQANKNQEKYGKTEPHAEKSKSIFILDETLYFYRLNTESLSKSKKNIENTLISYNFILKEHIKLLNKNNSLFYSIVPVLRSYIQFCLVNKGYIYAKKEWMEYKKIPELGVGKISKISKISHILFMIIGEELLYLLYLIRK